MARGCRTSSDCTYTVVNLLGLQIFKFFFNFSTLFFAVANLCECMNVMAALECIANIENQISEWVVRQRKSFVSVR